VPDVDLDLLVPEPIVLRRRDGTELATIPGEIAAVRMLELSRMQAEGAAHERVLLDLPDVDENREVREAAAAGIRDFYAGAAAVIDEFAELAEGVERLELTGTQIIAIVSMLVAPQQRMQLLATAYLMAVGVEFDEDGEPVPLDDGSPASSSPSGEPAVGRAPTGASSRGASGSRSAPKRKRKPSSS
jgi:hypothetical protein